MWQVRDRILPSPFFFFLKNGMKQSFKSKETVLFYILDKGNPALPLKYISTEISYKYSSACREFLANNPSWLITHNRTWKQWPARYTHGSCLVNSNWCSDYSNSLYSLSKKFYLNLCQPVDSHNAIFLYYWGQTEKAWSFIFSLLFFLSEGPQIVESKIC